MAAKMKKNKGTKAKGRNLRFKKLVGNAKQGIKRGVHTVEVKAVEVKDKTKESIRKHPFRWTVGALAAGAAVGALVVGRVFFWKKKKKAKQQK